MRINDGFKFATARNGIVTMVREFPVKVICFYSIKYLRSAASACR